MAETGNSGSEKRDAGLRATLPSDTLELISRLDREIEKLRELAPSGYEKTIIGLREAMQSIHDAIDRPTPKKRR